MNILGVTCETSILMYLVLVNFQCCIYSLAYHFNFLSFFWMMVVSCLCSDKNMKILSFYVQNFWLMILTVWSNRPHVPKTLSGNYEVKTIFIIIQRHAYFFHCVEIYTAGIKARQATQLVSYTNQGGTTSSHCILNYFTRGLKTFLKSITFKCQLLRPPHLMFCVSQWKVSTKFCVVCLSAIVSQGKVLVQLFELQDEQDFFFVEYFYLKE